MADDAKKKNKRDAFASVAFWEFMAFLLLLSFVWASNWFDIPGLVFGRPPQEFDMFRTSFLSAVIIVAGIIAVGHTYLRQKELIKPLMMTCLYCHRVRTDEKKDEWTYVEEYVINNFPVAMGQTACPECKNMLNATSQRENKVST